MKLRRLTVKAGRYQPVDIHVEAYDSSADYYADLTQIIDKENVNIRQVETLSNDDNIAFLKFHIEVSGCAFV